MIPACAAPRRATSPIAIWAHAIAAAATTSVVGVAFAEGSSPPPSQASEPRVALPVLRYRLASGVRVALAPDPSLDNVSVIVRYDVGSADDPPGKDGLAHLVEHLMFGGSRHVAPGDFGRLSALAGATNVNALTHLDDTTYTTTVPRSGLPVVFWLESDRMGFLADRLNNETLEREKRLIADESRDLLFDRDLGVAGAAGWLQLFPARHPYHRDRYSTHVESCTLDDVRAFLRTWYSPSNATIGVAGDFDASAVRSLIEQYFGDLPGGRPPERPDIPNGWRVHDVRIDVGAGISHDVVSVMWTAPALDQPGDAALDLAANILADGEGRLQNDLVSPGLASSVSARESSYRRASQFWISAVASDGAAEAVAAALDRAVADLGERVRPEEYRRAHDEWFDESMFRLQTSLGRAFHLVRTGAPEVPWELDKYDAIGPAEVAAAVRSNLIPDHRVVLVVHHDRQYSVQGVVLSRKERLP